MGNEAIKASELEKIIWRRREIVGGEVTVSSLKVKKLVGHDAAIPLQLKLNQT